MDLTNGLQNIQKLNVFKRLSAQYSYNESSRSEQSSDSIIDLDKINYDSDETWLCSTGREKCGDVTNWLHNDINEVNSQDILKNDNQRNIDTRTFTRPKKRFSRPSIEKYNQDLYGIGDVNELSSLESSKRSMESVSNNDNTSKPLHFDLTQPTSSYYFENVIAKAGEADSFQNMSPPSLVNSMCSSTFANLMESSFIKNDPVLREIRDTDYTESILLQDCEPPMFQSFTDSISSINSDSPESFLKKLSFNGTFKKNVSNNFQKATDNVEDNLDLHNSQHNETIVIQDKSENQKTCDNLKNKSNSNVDNFGGTYRRTPKHSNTFRKSDKKSRALNATFQMSVDDPQNTIEDTSIGTETLTILAPKQYNDMTMTKEKTSPFLKKNNGTLHYDLNRLSYCIDQNEQANKRFTDEHNDLNQTVNLGRNSTGSADSLDRMSSLSNSSKGSNKMLNMADVDAIVEMQEKSLQVMSTPKPNKGLNKMWENNFISPIVSSNQYSDSDSNDDYKSVKSSASKISVDNPSKGVNSLKTKIEVKIKKPLTKNVFTLPNTNSIQNVPNNVRASYGNLKTMGTLGGSQSNLKTMGQKLKGSYTSLRPISAFLPVAPPLIKNGSDLNTTTVLDRATNPNVTQVVETEKVAQVNSNPRISSADTFTKPQHPRMSGLPRPVGASGLPRPISRIPGPKSNLRPMSAKPVNNFTKH